MEPLTAKIRSSVVALTFAVAAWSTPADAYFFMEVTAAGSGGVATKSSNGLAGNGNVLYGFAAQDLGSGNGAGMSFEPAPPCAFLRPETGCGVSIGNAYTDGEINGNTGTLRAVSAATASFPNDVGFGESDISLELGDSLLTQSAGDVVFDLHADVSFSVVPDLAATFSGGDFVFRFATSTDLASDSLLNPDFEFSVASSASGGSTHETISHQIVLANVPANTFIFFAANVFLETACSATDVTPAECLVTVDSSNTSVIGVTGDVVSVSGYQYPGIAAVPLPPTIWFVAPALLGLGVRRRIETITTKRVFTAPSKVGHRFNTPASLPA